MTILSSLAAFFGVAMALSNFAQAYKIFKRKSAKDISIAYYLILTAGAIVWLLYGIEAKDFAIIISYSSGLVGFSSIVLGWFLYGRERK